MQQGYETTRKKSSSKSSKVVWSEFFERAAQVSIAVAQSCEYGEWQSSTWEFTRRVKGQTAFDGKTADEMLDVIPWQCLPFDEEDQLQFLCEWDRVDRLSCIPILSWAAEMAQRRPLRSGARFKIYREFISLAGHLQVAAGADRPIFLPTRKVAEVLEAKSKSTIASMCKVAIKDGFLTLVEEGNERRAPRYLFSVERFPELQERT